MKLKKIEFRNIGPFGNKLQSIDLPEDGGLWMVTGKNGNGKCHSKNTKLTVEIDDIYIRNIFLNYINSKEWSKRVNCKLGDLYLFNKVTSSIDAGFFKVETQFGFKRILGVDITAKNSKRYKIETETGKTLEISPDHLLFNGRWTAIKNINIGERIKTRDGYETLIKKILIEKQEDLYDIQVEEVNEFYANDIVSHNSFFVNLPKILYYGKFDRFKKDEIANRLNKHGWIRGIIEVSPETTITIERNLSPSSLIVMKNGEDIGKAGITDYQSYIDSEVVSLPYHIFSNTISLSINDFKSFLSMTPGDKRVIIDKLFSMEIINKMDEIIRKDLRSIKTNIDLFDKEISSIRANIDVAVKELKELKQRINENNTTKIEELTKNLEEYEIKLQEAYNKKKEWEEKLNDVSRSQKLFMKQKIKIMHTIEHIEQQINLFNKDKCPTCGAPFSHHMYDTVKHNLQDEYKQQVSNLENLKNEEQKYNIMIDKINEGLKTINNFIINIQTGYRTIKSELNRIKVNKSDEFKSIQNIISDNTITLNNKNQERQKHDEEYKYLSILEQLYSDAGVKKKILESYLPTLNKEIEYTLNELHFPYTLYFDSEFEPILYHLGVSISVDTLSTGEKKKVDLAALISILRMLKRKYPEINILMLDEVLSSIDGDGIFDIIGILQKMAKDLKINIFIINHTSLPIEHFDYRIEINKNAGFSDILIEKLNN